MTGQPEEETMLAPMMRCEICRHHFSERGAYPAERGRHRGELVSPVCRHPLRFATYIDTRRHPARVLIAYAPAELEYEQNAGRLKTRTA